IKNYKIKNAVERVSVKEVKEYKSDSPKYRVALLDFGLKQNIVRELTKRGCDVWVFPYNSTLRDIKSINPDGIMLSNGPGDPADNVIVIENVKEIIKANIPIFGICLGHQILALANGFKTHKLKYGHRGANQPVKDLISGKTYISSQNHGYAVTSESIDKDIADQWFINVNDNTCEGIIYKNYPILSVQFHPEACAGPRDTAFLFDKFIESMGG
ncbi:MAG: carbamoyl phosphate synthase small subunit, partial [Clostridiales bacterium]|nr:carbamoyl phosphate synthase small subunit [Clostridiales bacterium]